MPAFGAEKLLDAGQIDAVANFVLSLSEEEHDATLAATGKQLFADNCAACHGDNGDGNRDIGAPRLTDAIALYGEDSKEHRRADHATPSRRDAGVGGEARPPSP